MPQGAGQAGEESPAVCNVVYGGWGYPAFFDFTANTATVMRYSDWNDFARALDALGLFHMDLGLDRIGRVLDGLGLKRLACPVVQVVGTNGKGSTSHMLAAIAREHGIRTGLYTSPHFVTPRERIRVDGAMLSEERWVELANRADKGAVEAGGDSLTYFELLTVMAAAAFAEEGCELVVLEAGLGGTYDATTAFETDLTLFTSISLDHTHILGETVQAIAADKAGAMRPDVPAVSAPQADEAMAVLSCLACRRSVPLTLAGGWVSFDNGTARLPGGKIIQDARLGLAGVHQRDNAALAMAGWEALAASQGWVTDPTAVGRGLRNPGLPGRLQIVPGFEGGAALILDGAHNPAGLAALRDSLAADGIRPGAVITAGMADKDLTTAARIIREITESPVFVPDIDAQGRAAPAPELARRIGGKAEAVSSVEEALALALRESGPDGHVLVCGSLYLLGEFYKVRPDCLDVFPVRQAA